MRVSRQSQRIVVASWWLFCLVIVTSYSGSFVAFSTVPKQAIPFRTLDELAEQTEYEMGVLKGSAYESHLAASHYFI